MSISGYDSYSDLSKNSDSPKPDAVSSKKEAPMKASKSTKKRTSEELSPELLGLIASYMPPDVTEAALKTDWKPHILAEEKASMKRSIKFLMTHLPNIEKEFDPLLKEIAQLKGVSYSQLLDDKVSLSDKLEKILVNIPTEVLQKLKEETEEPFLKDVLNNAQMDRAVMQIDLKSEGADQSLIALMETCLRRGDYKKFLELEAVFDKFLNPDNDIVITNYDIVKDLDLNKLLELIDKLPKKATTSVFGIEMSWAQIKPREYQRFIRPVCRDLGFDRALEIFQKIKTRDQFWVDTFDKLLSTIKEPFDMGYRTSKPITAKELSGINDLKKLTLYAPNDYDKNQIISLIKKIEVFKGADPDTWEPDFPTSL
ncbi:MAG: hypothetical protein H0W88_11825 [Parachlamydiaceae bacterium]|nr:hypothetical protein [Parachlamydiaceae bacterium]